MTDRDHFAAAALTGMLEPDDVLSDTDWWKAQVCRKAYEWADAMLRERVSTISSEFSSKLTNLDAAPAAKASVESVAPQPTTRGDSDRKDKPAPRPSEGTGDTPATHTTSGECRTPREGTERPTLTDAEREAVVQAIGLVDWHKAYFSHLKKGEPLPSATLRGLLERMK